jgi:hypothetical protein
MSPAPKSKPSTRNSGRPPRYAARFEDDAEQTLKEIAAVQLKSADRRDDSARVLRDKRTKSRQ